MGAKFRRKIAAGQHKKAVGSLTNDVRQLAGFVRMNALAQQAVIKALIEHLGCEKEVRAIVQKYEDEMRKSTGQKADTVTADRPFKLRYTQPIVHKHAWDVCGFDESEADHMGHCEHGLHGCDCAVCRAKYAEPVVTAAEVNGGPVAIDSKFTDDTPVHFSSIQPSPAPSE